MKKNLLVTLADENYIDQAKQLFSSVYWNAGWNGDYMLLAHEIPEEKLKWFRKKGILVKQCRPFYGKPLRGRPITVLSKFYLFTPEFKKWKNIIYLDADIVVRASLDELTKIKGFAAVQGLDYLSRLFISQLAIKIRKKDKGIFNKLKKDYNLKEPNFNSGVLVFNTGVIERGCLNKLKQMLYHYSELISDDEVILNLLFYKKWIRLSEIYNTDAPYLIKVYNIKPENIRAIVLHFIKNKPWNTKGYFYEEWKSNLDKADLIDIKRPQNPRRTISEQEIQEYELFLKRRKVLIFYRHICYYISIFLDRTIGLVGIHMKKSYPKIYCTLKHQYCPDKNIDKVS